MDEDDKTIDPSNLSRDESDRLSGSYTSPYLDSGDAGAQTSVDSALTGPVRKYLPGDVVDGDYQLVSVLGRGGMGVVFACRHLVLDQTYAIKLLSGESLNNEHWSRFQSEAKALAKLNHPGIVGIYNMGIDGGNCPYYVMDLLSGEALDSVLARSGPLSVEQALDCFIKVADALSCAHQQGIIHRDIKPSNLMIVRGPKGEIVSVKIVDFGIARLSKQGLGTQSQTATGLVFGTPIYMSPEQSQGLRVDERSDIYSFGCALFEALTGSPPFKGENSFDTFLMHQTKSPPRLADRVANPAFSPSLELALDKMLRKDPADRYQKTDQIKHDLERIKSGKEIMPRGLATSATRIGAGQTARDPLEDEAEAIPARPWTLPQRLLALVVLPLIFVSGLFFVIQQVSVPPKLATISEKEDLSEDPLTDSRTLERMGATAAEKQFITDYDYGKADEQQRFVEAQFKTYFKKAMNKGIRFFNEDRSEADFPSDIIVGAIGIGNSKPIAAIGHIALKGSDSVTFYQNYCVRKCPEFVDLFGLQDLTGLEVTVSEPARLIEKIKNWRNLKELCFFNSLIKALPNFENYDESGLTNKDLAQVEQFSNLDTLGLCGPNVTGMQVAKMDLLHHLKSLRIKHITDVETLLKNLPELDNLHEVWLISLNTTDDQLQYLVKMKNLESVRIRRSALTPASLEAFRKMPSLKHLYLDRNWDDAQKAQFKSVIPGFEYEHVLDTTYWPVLPNTSVETLHEQ